MLEKSAKNKQQRRNNHSSINLKTIMEFKLVQSKKKGKNDGDVAISKAMLKEIITLLNKVDCTCVWCDATQEYLKVQDVPQDLVDELIMLDKLC